MKFQHFIVLAAILLSGLALGLWRLDAESIWHDEAWSIRAIQSPFGTPDDNTPPLYYFTLHLLQKLGAGETPFALRYGSVLIHLLTISLGFRIGYRWYGLVTGAVFSFLLAFSPLLWEYAQEVRAYVAVPFFALALLSGTYAFLKSPQPQTWLFLLGVELAGLYTHNLVVPMVAWVNIVIFMVLAWRILQPHPPAPSPQVERGSHKIPSSFTARGRTIGMWIASQAILFVFYLPWLLTQSPSGTTLNTVPKFNQALLENIWQAYFFPVIASDLPDSFILKLQLLAVMALFAALILLWRERNLKTLLILSQLLLLPIFSSILIIRASIDFHPRYYVLGVPALLLLLAAGIKGGGSYRGRVTDRAPTKSRRINANVVKLGFAVLTVGFAVLITQQSLSLIAENRRYQHDDFAAMADYYAALPSDAVILIPYDHEYTFEVYFDEKIRAKIVNIPLHSSPEKAIEKINEVINGTKWVEVLTWFQLPADERGMYPCLLSAASDQLLATYEVYGLSTTGYQISQPIEMQGLETDSNFNSALTLNNLRYTDSQNGLCLQSEWTLTRPPDSDIYQVAARILNPFEWEIAAADSLILRDDQARIEHWEIGETGTAFTFLQLPDGAPPIVYQSLLRLYTPQNLSGYDAVNPEGASLGKDIRLPEIMMQGTASIPETVHVMRDNTNEGVLYSGQRLQLEIASPQNGKVTLGELSQPVAAGLNWIEFSISDDVAGEVVLALHDQPIKTYTILKTERLFAVPEFDIPIGAEFQEIANLAGATVTQTGDELQVVLVWQAFGTPATSYKVFVQILDENGNLLLTDDTIPANEQRPTTSWVEGEYIQDSHNLHLNGLEYKQLIVGLYNPITAQRVLLLDGTDFVEIPTR